MITLYGFGPAFGLPDPSPFVTKAEVLLKMAGQPYVLDTHGFGKAPNGKLPYIVDDGETISDSTFIRWHLEKNITSISIEVFKRETAPPRGRSKSCSRTISIGQWSIPAGWTTPISPKDRALFFAACLR